jgi:spore germination protein YaaH
MNYTSLSLFVVSVIALGFLFSAPSILPADKTARTTPSTESVATHSEVAEPAPLKLPRELVQVLGWIPYWDQEIAVSTFKENVDIFDFISLFWYRIDSEGELVAYRTAKIDRSIIEFAREHDVKVFVLVANLPDYPEGGDWDYKRVDRVISTAEARTYHVNELVALVEELDVDGINIDYEALRKYQRDNFTKFIEELSVALHADGKLLGVALHPKTSENNPAESNGSEAQDWSALYPFVDQMQLMTYGEHYLKSHPGPIASINWIDEVLNYAVGTVGIPLEKVFMGIPLYAQEWYQDTQNSYIGIDQDVTHSKLAEIVSRYNISEKWDLEFKSPYITYTKREKKHVVWFENSESFAGKLDLAQTYQIRNFAFWRLGGEDKQVWEILRTELRK